MEFSHIVHKCRTAGSCFPFLFFDSMGKFFRFRNRNHIAADGRFHHIIEAQFLDTCKNLFHFYITELAGNSRRNGCIHMIFCIIDRISDQIQYIHDKGFIHDGTKRTLADTGTTGNAFIMVDHRFSVFVHLNCTYRAGTHAGTHYFTDGTKRTVLFAFTAFDTQFLIDVSSVVHNGNRTSGAVFLTLMTQTATTGVTDYKSVQRTFITGRIQYIDDNIIFCGLQHQMYTVFDNVSFLIDTAAEHGLWPGNDRFCDISFQKRIFYQCAAEKTACYFFIYQILDILHITFEIFHTSRPFENNEFIKKAHVRTYCYIIQEHTLHFTLFLSYRKILQNLPLFSL